MQSRTALKALDQQPEFLESERALVIAASVCLEWFSDSSDVSADREGRTRIMRCQSKHMPRNDEGGTSL